MNHFPEQLFETSMVSKYEESYRDLNLKEYKPLKIFHSKKFSFILCITLCVLCCFIVSILEMGTYVRIAYMILLAASWIGIYQIMISYTCDYLINKHKYQKIYYHKNNLSSYLKFFDQIYEYDSIPREVDQNDMYHKVTGYSLKTHNLVPIEEEIFGIANNDIKTIIMSIRKESYYPVIQHYAAHKDDYVQNLKNEFSTMMKMLYHVCSVSDKIYAATNYRQLLKYLIEINQLKAIMRKLQYDLAVGYFKLTDGKKFEEICEDKPLYLSISSLYFLIQTYTSIDKYLTDELSDLYISSEKHIQHISDIVIEHLERCL